MTDALTDYLTERGPKITSARVVACAVEALTAFWQGCSVADITPQACERYADWRGRSENTVRRELNVLATAAGYAFKNGRITRKVHVVLPSKPPGKERWLSRREVALILRAALQSDKARTYLPLFILIAVYTGRRKEAILSLRWCQIDLDAGLINFEGSTKRSNKRRGRIPIPKRLLPHLRRAAQGQPEMGFVLNINGARICEIYRGLTAAAKRAGVECVAPHVLKHTAITWAMQNRADLWEAAGFFATSVPTLIRVYGHHHPEHMRGVAETIGRRPGVGSRMGR